LTSHPASITESWPATTAFNVDRQRMGGTAKSDAVGHFERHRLLRGCGSLDPQRSSIKLPAAVYTVIDTER